MGNFQDKVVLITGASRGLGRALSHGFAKQGATLILMARQLDGLERLDAELDQYNVKTTLVPLDLSKPDKLLSLPAALDEKYGRLDVLIGNAGYLGNLSPLTHFSPRDFQKVMDINVTANWYLLTGLESLLKKSAAPKEIFLTSGAANLKMPYWGPYAASKAALNEMILTYAKEMQKTKFCINVVDPGVMQTDMFQKAMPGVDFDDPQCGVAKVEDKVAFFLDLAKDTNTTTGKLLKV